ncbi:hypothetical protein BDW22DRAFT_1350543 [Trametopsis cervina]|nr:hypothetical protein BDW22DRAFT_1350543 [Trametopsis cervina]
MATPASSTGLGINLQSRDAIPQLQTTVNSGPRFPSDPEARRRLRRTLTGPRAPTKARPKTTIPALLASRPCIPHSTSQSGTISSANMRSMRGMQGLTGAEIGDSMVAFEADGGSVREGSRFALDPLTPGGCTLPPMIRRHSTSEGSNVRNSPAALPRDVTLLSFGISHLGGASADLKSLLGDSNARLKSGAVILPGRSRTSKDKKVDKQCGVALEQAKHRARVEVDIVLESNVCVQGGYVRGHIKVRIRKRSKKQSPVALSEGKIRIVGYEMISDGDHRHIFYQCAAPLSAVTDAAQNIYCSTTDEDGFTQGLEGMHVLPFALHLPSDGSFGTPKGTLHISTGAVVRYIAMVSIRVKDPDTGTRSLAHFYRDCEVWPLLDPSTILQPALRPIQATAHKSVSLIGGASAKVKLNAQLHRLNWPAGSRCPVSMHVTNGSKKTIRSLMLTLVRTTTVFRPRHALDTEGDRDPDSCQTTTLHKVVAESSLEMGAGIAKGRASAKGWWTGISPGQELEFVHFIMLPPEALSITRARLLEVEYSIRVTLSAGSLASDVAVTLPIRIFSFISIDPPPSAGLLSNSGAYIRSTQLPAVAALERVPSTFSRSKASVHTRLPTTMEDEEENEYEPEHSPEATPTANNLLHRPSLRIANPDISPVLSEKPPLPKLDTTVPLSAIPSEASMYSTGTASSQGDEDSEADAPVDATHAIQHGTLELDGDIGSDEELDAVLKSAKIEQGPFGAHTNGSVTTPEARMKSRGQKQSSWGTNSPSQKPIPRMEGVGSGMRSSWKKDEERNLLIARLRERARRGIPQPVIDSTSGTDETEEDTPKLGSTKNNANDGLPDSFDCDRVTASVSHTFIHPHPSSLERKESRKLPRPPSTTILHTGEGNTTAPMRHSHMGIIHRQAANTMPGLPRPSALHSRSPRKQGTLKGLPHPPAVPEHTDLQGITKVFPVQSTLSDSAALRKIILSPPRSPVRPPRSPLRLYRGGSSGSTSTEEVQNDGEDSPIRQRIMALEHRVKTNGW